MKYLKDNHNRSVHFKINIRHTVLGDPENFSRAFILEQFLDSAFIRTSNSSANNFSRDEFFVTLK